MADRYGWCDLRGRDWIDVATNQVVLMVPRSQKRQRMDSPLLPPEAVQVLPDSGLQNGDNTFLLLLSPPGLW